MTKGAASKLIPTSKVVLRLPAALPDLRRKNRCEHKPWVDSCRGDK